MILASLLIMVGSFKNLTFLMVAIINTVIGIYQELRAKRAVDALTLVATATIAVLRDGKKSLIPSDKLVQDDIVEFSAGQQICADAVVRSGNILVNESLLTGESDAIEKSTGCELKSGSFVVSGRCLAQLTQVGVESYTAKLAAEARRNTRSTKSEMMRSLSKLIQVVGIALVPMGIMLFLRHYLDAFQGMDLRNSVEATVAALIGMIPEGLYLLTSIAIAASCLKLSKSRVLIQDMNCIETLAHVDILCVDKTGTITEPGMEVEDVLPLSSRYSHDNIEEILAAFYHGEEPDNETAKAMSLQFDRNTDWSATQRLPFSSDTKWSGADFGSNGCYIIGAPEFIMATRYNEIQEKAELMSSRGCRVLLLASYGASLNKNLDISQLEPLALIFLSNFLRPDAKNTFRYFAQQGVSVRVISGDNPLTVSEIAQRAGILNAE
ncbi:MAG: HAD-IC family P-type ATPase, partial [Oscillospiraceae bacterium]|nr:HAD-IC family P-type ATPase [Oscillospiraceae bacterium]